MFFIRDLNALLTLVDVNLIVTSILLRLIYRFTVITRCTRLDKYFNLN